jgi:hypothetical protein
MVSLHAQPQVPPSPRDRLGDFQCTKPPTFSQTVEPMDANDWLKSVEKKLQVVQCNNREKVLLENRSGVMEHKCKLVCQHQPGSNSRPRVATSSVGPVFHPAQPQF